jgi:uncharacterized cupredoxin-like copper-binding protein
MRRQALACLGLAALGVAAAPADGAGTTGAVALTVTEREYSVTLSRAVLPAGARVRIVVRNAGSQQHEAVLERAGSANHPLHQGGRATELEDIAPGGSKQATWIITKPGRYQIACHVPGHYRKGMVRTFIVAPG